MRAIQLYADTPEGIIEREEAIKPNPDCQRCCLCDDASSVCMRAAGEPGGALLVGDFPGAVEDRRGVPFSGQTGRFLHRYASSIWSGPLAVDNAVRCYPKKLAVGKEEIEACRGYLAHTVRLVKPTRIVAMGGKAIQGVLGRAVPLMSVRRGYGWLYNAGINDTNDPIPVFELFNPVNALRNKFMRKMFEADLRWALTCKLPEAPPWEEDCYVIENRADSEQACSILRAAEWFSYDCEAVGVQYKDDYVVIALAACARGSSTVYVWDREALYNPHIFAPLGDLLQDPSVGKTGQNLKYDSHAVDCAFGIKLQNYVGDARLQRRLLAADVDASLDVLAELVGLGGIKHEAKVALAKAQRMLTAARKRYKADPEGQTVVLKDDDPILLSACINHEEKPKTYTYGLIDDTIMLRYNARDALTTARACELMEARLEHEPVVKRVWSEIVSHANFAIKTVERWGIPTRLENVESYQSHLDSKMEVIKARFAQYEGLKLNSPKSVGDLLYKQLGLQAPKTTETGESSTDHETLVALRGQHAVVDDLLEWRRLGKLYGFAKGIERHICPDGRIHPSIKIDGTRTGRLSCNEPNLQNISRPKDEDAKFARDLFVAEPGWELLEVDYSQLELRVATMLCQDPKMLEIWQSGVDYHQRTAELISQVAWGIPPSEVTKEHRSKAKVPNFGVIYGMTAKGLAQRLGCSIREAENIINAIKGEFTVFAAWCKAQVDLARQTGFVWTWWAGERARRRPLFDVASKNSLKRSNAENGAVNTPVQGTASDFCLASITELVPWLIQSKLPAELVLTVHDSIMFHARSDVMEEVAHNAQRIMTQWESAGVPLVVDMKRGESWGSLEDYKFAA